MMAAASFSTGPDALANAPGPDTRPEIEHLSRRTRGVMVTGENGEDGTRGFYIPIETLPGRQDEIVQMLREIFARVLVEPGTGSWFGAISSTTAASLFEAVPDIVGREGHIGGEYPP